MAPPLLALAKTGLWIMDMASIHGGTRNGLVASSCSRSRARGEKHRREKGGDDRWVSQGPSVSHVGERERTHGMSAFVAGMAP